MEDANPNPDETTSEQVDEKITSKEIVTPPLPPTRADLERGRKVFMQKSINDYVDEIHGVLWENLEYQKFFRAIYNAQALEGSTGKDHDEAARMIRDYARQSAIPMIANEKLHPISLALNVVRRRLQIDVTYRKKIIHGEVVEDDNTDNTDNDDQ